MFLGGVISAVWDLYKEQQTNLRLHLERVQNKGINLFLVASSSAAGKASVLKKKNLLKLKLISYRRPFCQLQSVVLLINSYTHGNHKYGTQDSPRRVSSASVGGHARAAPDTTGKKLFLRPIRPLQSD